MGLNVKKLSKMYSELVPLMKQVDQEKENNKEIKKQILEQKLIKVIETHPQLLYLQENFESQLVHMYTFQYHALNLGYYELVKKIFENEEVCKLDFWEDNNVMEYVTSICAKKESNKLLAYILHTNPTLIRHISHRFGYNIGMSCVNFCSNTDAFDYIVKATINDEIASLQTDPRGNNIGMMCADRKKQELFDLAYQNPKARLQKNNNGNNMAMIAQNKGLIVPPLSEEEVKEYYDQLLNEKIDEICK